MKKLYLTPILFLLFSFVVFAQTDEREEVDYLLFLPDSGNQFVNEEQARIQLDNVANYLRNRNLAPGQIQVYGYTAAAAVSDVEPVPLSVERALFVIGQLQRRGVPREWFADPVGFGSVNFWGSNQDEENRRLNRRVRILLEGSILTAQVVEPELAETEVVVESAVEESVILAADDVVIESADEKSVILTAEDDEIKKKKKFKFPWILLLIPLLLLLFLLLKNRKKTADKKPAPPPVAEKAPKKIDEPRRAPEPVIAASAAPPPVAEKPALPVAEKAPEKIDEPERAPEPVIAAAAAPPPVQKKESVVYIEEEIRIRAYEIYKERGGEEDAVRDWYIALPEVCARYEAKGYEAYKEDGCWWVRKEWFISG